MRLKTFGYNLESIISCQVGMVNGKIFVGIKVAESFKDFENFD